MDDPLFSAHNQSAWNGNFSTPTADLSVLGCTEQYQFCNTEKSKCTELSGLYSVLHAVENGDLGFSPQQTATFKIVWKAAWSMVLQWTTTVLDDSVLLAQDFIFTTKSMTSSPLPDTQWQEESYVKPDEKVEVSSWRDEDFILA